MSEFITWHVSGIETNNKYGKWVKRSDYAKLEKENAKLEERITELKSTITNCPLYERGIAQQALIGKQDEYIKLLEGGLRSSHGIAFVHGYRVKEADIAKGEELRTAISKARKAGGGECLECDNYDGVRDSGEVRCFFGGWIFPEKHLNCKSFKQKGGGK